MSLLHLETGSPCPDLTKGTLRFYSMVFCPYAQRVKLVLVHKNIQHETVNVNLIRKPEWLFQKNAVGKVPILEQDDKIILESAICMDYLDEAYPDNRLNLSDPYKRAQAKMKMEEFGPFISCYYGYIRADGEEREEKLNKLRSELSKMEMLVEGKFIMGDCLSMADYFIWPWIERMCVVNVFSGADMLDKAVYPKLHAWNAAMLEDPAVKEVIISEDYHLKYRRSYLTGNPDYDMMYK